MGSTAGDAGGSLGAALAYLYDEKNYKRQIHINDDMQGSYLGPMYSQDKIIEQLKDCGANFDVLEDDELMDKTVEDLNNGKVIGWFQGRMEFGPRALGNRSIIGDPRSEKMQKLKFKS